MLISVLVVGAGVGLGVGAAPSGSDDQWAEVMVETCRSIIARARLRNPTPEELSVQRFLDERKRLLQSGRSFNTVSAFRNVCGAVRDEITANSNGVTTESGISPATSPPKSQP